MQGFVPCRRQNCVCVCVGGGGGSVSIAYIMHSFQKFTVCLFCPTSPHIRAALCKLLVEALLGATVLPGEKHSKYRRDHLRDISHMKHAHTRFGLTSVMRITCAFSCRLDSRCRLILRPRIICRSIFF